MLNVLLIDYGLFTCITRENKTNLKYRNLNMNRVPNLTNCQYSDMKITNSGHSFPEIPGKLFGPADQWSCQFCQIDQKAGFQKGHNNYLCSV
jgi:hypothetical protein